MDAAPAALEGAQAAPADAPRAADPDGLSRKLVWLTLFRLAIVTVLLGGTAIVNLELGPGAAVAVAPLYGVVLVTYLASLGMAFALRARRALVALAYVQIVLDVAVAAGVVAVTGYSDSVFVVLFSIGIVNGSILLFRRGAIAAACLAVPTYLVVAVAADPRGGAVPRSTLFVHASALVAIAALSSYLAELLRATGERLVAQEGALAEITALHETVVQSMTSGLLTVDAAGRITYLNRAGEQLTGLDLGRVRGRPVVEWFAAFRPGTPRGEVEWSSPVGRTLRLGYSEFPLRGRDGAPIGSAVIFQDLTELRSLEEAMHRSRRLADLGRVAAGLAHELRNPLAAMAGSLEVLRAGATLPDEDRRLVDIVLREAERLDGLVTGLLDFTRPPPLRRIPTDLAALVGEAVDVFAHDPAAASARVERELAPVTVECDPDQVRQIVWNLLVNAGQAIGARAGREGRIRIACGPERAGARLVVEDDGPGIVEADLPRLFLPFFTTKRKGSGLGLATVQRVVDAHGGSISVDARPGRGARFVVHLPAEPRAASSGPLPG